MKRFVGAVLILCMILATNVSSKEVGDIMYHRSTPLIGFPHYSNMWGKDGIGLTVNPTVSGHAMTYLGADENGDEWIIESGPDDFRKVLKKEYGGIIIYNYSSDDKLKNNILGYYTVNNNAFSSVDRKKVIAFEYEHMIAGDDWVHIFEDLPYPIVKGPNRWNCVSLIEGAYENAGYNITPDGKGRCTINLCVCGYRHNWNEGELSHIAFPGLPLLNEWMFMPYTQWYKQLTPDHNKNQMRLIPAVSVKPTVKIINPTSGERVDISQSQILTVKAKATDGIRGSGIYKVEFYLDSIYKGASYTYNTGKQSEPVKRKVKRYEYFK